MGSHEQSVKLCYPMFFEESFMGKLGDDVDEYENSPSLGTHQIISERLQ